MILCKNGHPNEDGATYCVVCKVYIDATAQAVAAAPEPPIPQTPQLSLSASRLSVQAGGEVSGELRLQNPGSTDDDYGIEPGGQAAAWASVEPPFVSLAPGAVATAKLTFRPDASAPSGELPFELKVTSRLLPAQPVSAHGVLEIAPLAPQPPLSAELSPQVSAGRVNGEHVLTLRNTGAQTAISEPAVAETDGDVNVVLDPSTIAIERGETASARVRVTPKRPLWLGRRRTHRFGLNVSPGVSVDGSMVQKARIPPWTLLAAVIPILVVIFLLISSGSDTVAGRVIARLPLNVRAEPSDNSKIIGDLPSGTEVRISCQTADSRDRLWDRLASPFSGGYVFDRFVRRTEDPKRCT